MREYYVRLCLRLSQIIEILQEENVLIIGTFFYILLVKWNPVKFN